MDEETASVIFWFVILGVGIAWALYSAHKRKLDKEMLAQLPPEERTQILAERARKENEKREALERQLASSKEAQKRAQAAAQYGPVNAAMVCPHCQTKGRVRTKGITQKKALAVVKRLLLFSPVASRF
jgi:hypothetical protein